MTATIDDLKNLIRHEQIGDAIIFLEQNGEKLKNAIANDTSILPLLAKQTWKFDELALWPLWEMETSEYQNYFQWLPKEMAVNISELISNYRRLFNLLLEYGAKVNILDALGMTPLQKAVLLNNESMVQLLLEKGADVNIRNAIGDTPLFTAVWFNRVLNNESMVGLLLANGADVNVQNSDGYTPLRFAFEKAYGNKSIIKLLSEASSAKKKVEQPVLSAHSNPSLSSSSSSSPNSSSSSSPSSSPSSSSNSDLRASSNPHLVYQTLNASPRVPNANNSKDEQDPSEKKVGPGSSK